VSIPERDALYLQLAAIAGNEPPSSYFELRPLDPVGCQRFVPVRELRAAADLVMALCEHHQIYVGAAPRTRRAGTADAVERVWCLWADLDTPDSVAALDTFRPLPSIVIRSGTAENLHAWWPLREAMEPEWARRANRRLVLALGADMAATDVARVMRPTGSLNHKHSRAGATTCVRLELDVYTLPAVVGSLDDAPDYLASEPTSRAIQSGAASTLDRLVRTVREAHEGNRNNLLHWAACRVRERADVGELDEHHASAALRDAALAVGLGDSEIDATLRSALKRRAVA
jgi:hypothetical protein